MSSSTRDNYTFANQAAIPAFLRDRIGPYFRSWDNVKNDDVDHYLFFFSPTGTLRFGQSYNGHNAIKSFREGMVHSTNGPVVDLQHTLERCFVLAGDAGQEGKEEVMVNGSIWYRLKNGRKVDCTFSSWMVFSEQEGGIMLADYYEVYLDGHELMTAIGEMNAADGK